MIRRSLLFSCTALFVWVGSGVSAQVDSVAIGGPEEGSVYEEVDPTATDVPLIAIENSLPTPWTLRDSLALIPCYDLYCDWNTSSIFGHHDQNAAMAPVDLDLSHAACDHAMPICGKVNSPFGPRHGRMHYGVDLDLETGDAVVAAFAGMVRIARYHKSFGNVVVIRHPNGLETLYGHLSRLSVDVGEMVEAGERIGLGGSTGRSTGSHLHFEVRYLGRPIDPAMVYDIPEGELVSRQLHLSAKSFEAPATAARYYRVKRGDTLSAIARRQGTSVARLCKINRISARSTLRIGQTLRTL
ncbi:MAG: peptidoglycan DD-metalloendopeptidase family protein [Flavobacteriales bacterium]|nr:peptidoglycan DD-metalloendopeptidase family protein [Flavobacteriales bacterium]